MASFDSIEVAGELVAAGFTVWVEEGRLRYVGPAGELTQAQKCRVGNARDALITGLQRDGCRLTPPSPSQQRIHAAHALGGAAGAYNVPMAWRIDGPFDDERARICTSAIAARYEVLRQSFVRVGGHLVGVVTDHCEVDFSACSVLTPFARNDCDGLRDLLDSEANRPFDIAHAPLWRVRVLYATDGTCYLLWVFHHLICDEWSSALLLREFAEMYPNASVPADDPVAYREYVLWQRKQSRRARSSNWIDTFVRRLGGRETALPLRTDGRLQDQEAADFESRALATDVGDGVARSARSQGITEFEFLLAAFVMLLAYYGPRRDVVLVTPVTARLHERFVDVVGPAQKLAAIAATVEPDCDFASLCARIAEQVEETFAPEYPPIEDVLGDLAELMGGMRGDLPDVIFASATPLEPLVLNHARCTPVPLANRKAKTTLLAVVGREGRTLHVTFEYKPALIEPNIARQMLDEYCTLVEQCALDDSTSVRRLTDVLAERHRVLMHPQPSFDGTVPEWFDDVVVTRPRDLAIVGRDELSYAALSQWVSRIERQLPDSVRVDNTCVAVWGRMSARMIAAMLAVMRAGACVAPFDADLPPGRVAEICRRDNIGVVLTCDPDVCANAATVRAETCIRVVSADDRPHSTGDRGHYHARASDGGAAEADRGLDHQRQHPQSLAYVMYTSGSTGEPKGVGVSHRSFAAFIAWAIVKLDLRRLDAFNVLTHVSFDVSLFEVFGPLIAGCPLHIGDGRDYASRLRDAERGGLAAVPSVLRTALATGEFPPAPTDLFVAGEVFSSELVAQIRAASPRARVWNLYGPTEAVVYTSCRRVSCKRYVPIGAPRDGVSCYVLCDAWTMLPDGAVGELAVGGLVAREYVGMPALTAARFVPDPFTDDSGGRMYLTGDLVRKNGDGELEYVGRRDRQFKHFGMRIEPDEIERVLLEHPAVSAAVVGAEPNGGVLVASVEAQNTPRLEYALRWHCSARLPRGMTPQRIEVLDALPRTSAGKIDVATLTASHKRPDIRRAVPSEKTTPTQKMLVRIWTEVLGHEEVNIHTNFFDAGGNSIALLNVHNRLTRECVDPPGVTDLFVYTTIAQLAERLDSVPNADADTGNAVWRAVQYRTALRRHRIRYGNDGEAR